LFNFAQVVDAEQVKLKDDGYTALDELHDLPEDKGWDFQST
jgi:hypothetical protein